MCVPWSAIRSRIALACSEADEIKVSPSGFHDRRSIHAKIHDMSTSAEPSEYELREWQAVGHFRGRPLSQAARNASARVSDGVNEITKRTANYLTQHPGVKAAVAKGQNSVAKGARVMGTTAKKTVDAIPDGMVDWSSAAFGSIRQTVSRVSRVGLSPKRVVNLHKNRGHDVQVLADLRRLDLEQVHAVGLRGANWYYPASAALSGMGAGLVISGGEFVTAASAGAAAAPTGTAIVSAFAGDAVIVLGLASRSVGHISLLYGYDPEEPTEKLFVMSIINAGTAVSAGAKTAAMSDISRLTQALIRGKAWDILDKSVLARVSGKFATAFSFRLTKQGLGKVVPAAGIVIGGTLNWVTLEGIVDTAEIAYRRRFLLEKYPHLGDEENPESSQATAQDDNPEDEPISVLDDLAEAGGPDLR
jgi:hypothetical protein